VVRFRSYLPCFPTGKIGRNDFGGVGATIVDSLDTLWLMGLEAECAAARDWTAHNLTFHQCALFPPLSLGVHVHVVLKSMALLNHEVHYAKTMRNDAARVPALDMTRRLRVQHYIFNN